MDKTAALVVRAAFWFGFSWAALACTATIEGGLGSSAGASGSGSGANVGQAGASATGGLNSGGSSSMTPLDPATGTPSSCDASKPMAAPAPILRLTNREYRNTLADLFPGLTFTAAALPVDNKDDGFDTMASAQSVSSSLVEGYFTQASSVASAASANLAAWLPCAVGANSLSPSCRTELLSGFAARAYRRPVTSDELGRLTSLFTSAEQSFGEPAGIEVAVRGILQTPAFVYRPEFGQTPVAGTDTTPLTAYEIAARLSYLFWDSMPDAALTAAAQSGALDSADGVAAQARRLLAAPRTHDAVATFQSEWLRFEKMTTLNKSPTLFPNFNENTAVSLRNSASSYVDYLFWQRGTLDAFFTDTKAFVNDDLAAIYGVPKPGSSNLQLIDVDPARRAGVLTQAGLLAGFAHETSDAPVLRGVFVLSRLLCDTPPPPPPGVPPAPEAKPGDGAMTTRQRLEQSHVKPACMGCHQAIDGIGYGFSHYDAIGAWRDTDSGLPVDATGSLSRTLDVDGPFDGAVQLGQKLSKSAQVKACMTKQWYRYALGIGTASVDACALKPTIERFNASGNDLRELLVALVSSDALRRRTVVTP